MEFKTLSLAPGRFRGVQAHQTLLGGLPPLYRPTPADGPITV